MRDRIFPQEHTARKVKITLGAAVYTIYKHEEDGGMRRMTKARWLGLASASLIVLTAAGGTLATQRKAAPRPASPDALLVDGDKGDDWPSYGGTYDERHFSALTEINDRNVQSLGLAWYYDLPLGNPATIPVEVGGTLYVSSGLSIVRAFDVATGKLLWTYDSQVGAHSGKEMRSAWGIRGIAWWNGKVYTGTQDGRLIAIDAKTGKMVWSVQTTRKGNGQFVTGAPRVFDGKIMIGQGGGDSTTNRGYVTTYDAETGKQLWRFYVVPGNPAVDQDETTRLAAKSWTGEWWKLGGGGEPWNNFTYDRATNTILIGTGNGFPWNIKIRSPGGGDNLFLCSMVALDASTGAYKWHYQFNPGETWDYNSTMDMALADLTIDGKLRHVVMTAPKNGFFYVIDRTNGKLISAEKIAKVTWADHIDLKTGRPVEKPGFRFENGQNSEVWPSNTGAHSWMPMAYSPQTRLAYIPKIESGIVYNDRGIDLKNWKPTVGALGLTYGEKIDDPLQYTSALMAWDPVTQKQVWKVDTIGGWNGGVLATAGNLVFQGQLDGGLRAYAADTGKELWRFPTQAAILSAPISYRAGGHQYVTVVVGMGTSVTLDPATLGGLQFDARTQKRRILTFRLGGKASLPPAPPPFVLKPIEDASYHPDAALAARGATVYINCIACHGYNAASGGGAPDLRTSYVPQDAAAFRAIVHDGGLKDTGMPQFSELSDADLDALRQYLRSRAADLRAGKTD
jgi:quinohemoprotein ethanol dehydrogenase